MSEVTNFLDKLKVKQGDKQMSDPVKKHPIDNFCSYILKNRGVQLNKFFSMGELVKSCTDTKNGRYNLYKGVAEIAEFSGALNKEGVTLSSRRLSSALSKRLGLAFKIKKSEALEGDKYLLTRVSVKEGVTLSYSIQLLAAPAIRANQGTLNLEGMKGVTRVMPAPLGSIKYSVPPDSYQWIAPMREIMDKYASEENRLFKMEIFGLKQKIIGLERRLAAVSEVLNG
jgi:hypothetical protein